DAPGNSCDRHVHGFLFLGNGKGDVRGCSSFFKLILLCSGCSPLLACLYRVVQPRYDRMLGHSRRTSMTSITITVDDETAEALHRLAELEQRSEADIVRTALAAYAKSQPR